MIKSGVKDHEDPLSLFKQFVIGFEGFYRTDNETLQCQLVLAASKDNIMPNIPLLKGNQGSIVLIALCRSVGNFVPENAKFPHMLHNEE